jgi:hypothetical protein
VENLRERFHSPKKLTSLARAAALRTASNKKSGLRVFISGWLELREEGEVSDDATALMREVKECEGVISFLGTIYGQSGSSFSVH